MSAGSTQFLELGSPSLYGRIVPLRNLQSHQANFLGLFHVSPGGAQWREVAINDAITSASRRTTLYETPRSPRERSAVREFWSAQLEEKLAAYEAGRATFASDRQYQHDVMDLRARMNAAFPEVFLQHQIRTFEPGFRVAHAQKSLSLVLKHGWCNGTVEMPPHCVVDRRILRAANARQVEQRWTDVNTWEEHLEKMSIVEAAARLHEDWPLTLAEWELWAFAKQAPVPPSPIALEGRGASPSRSESYPAVLPEGRMVQLLS